MNKPGASRCLPRGIKQGESVRTSSLRGVASSDSLSAFDIFTGGTGALVASAAILRGVWIGWQRTFGRRRAFEARIRLLRIGMSSQFIVQALGVPTFGTVTERDRRDAFSEVRAVWSNRFGLLACEFDGGQLWAFTVMSTDRWFRPRLDPLTNGQLTGRLGARTFDALTDEQPDAISNQHGASAMNYAELHYFGRPGAYNDFVLNASSFGSPSPSPLGSTFDRGSYDERESEVRQYRKLAKPNAVTVSSASKGGGWAFNLVLMEEIESVSLSPLQRRG